MPLDIELILAGIMATATVAATMIAIKVYRDTRLAKLVKRSDLEATNENVKNVSHSVCNHEKRIQSIEVVTVKKEYVDQQDNNLHHRINVIENRTDNAISDLNKKTDEIYKLLVNLSQRL